MIRRLPESSKAAIAASFSITCLAAAAEELLLNSLDAQSSSIELSLRFSNFEVKVEDNGQGISDFILVGEAHCSSRNSTVPSYGTRGCALHSIGVLSTSLEVSSRVDSITRGKIISFGREVWSGEISDAKGAKGTVAIIKGLFSHQVVRQRTLNHRQELEQILNSITRLSLMHPSVSFLIRDEDAQSQDNRLGREILRIPRAANTLSRFQNLFGRVTTSLLHHVTHTSACGTLKVSGWCGRGHHSRELQFLYINGRCCKRVSTLNRIIDNASAGTLPRVSAPSFSPFSTPNTSSLSSTPRMNNKDASSSLVVKNELLYVLDIVCSRERVDVLHERDKTLVQFSDWAIVQSTLSFAIKKALGIESAPSIALSSAPTVTATTTSSGSSPSVTATTTSSGSSFLSPEPYRSPQSNFFSPPLLPAARIGETRTTAVAQSLSSSRVLSSSSSFLSSPSSYSYSASAAHRTSGCTDCNGHSKEVLEPPKSIVSAGVATDGTRKRRLSDVQSSSPESKARREASSSTLLLSTTTPPHQLALGNNRSPYFSSSSSTTRVTTPQLSHHLQTRESAAFDAVGLSLKALIESGKGSVAAEVDFIPRIGSVAGRPGRATLARFGSKLDKGSVEFMAMLRARQATAPSTSSSSLSFPTPPLHQYLPPLPPPPASCLSSGGSQVTKDVLKKLSAPESMIGQLDKKFIACITGQRSREVVIIDQHAADERVRLELIEAAVFGEKIAASPFSSTPDRIALSLDGMDIYLTPVSCGSSDSQISYFSYTLAFDPPLEMLDSTPRERHLMRSHAELLRTWGWNVFLDDPLLPPYLRQLPRFFDVQLGISELREFVEFIGSLSSSVIPSNQSGENVANAQKRLFRTGLFPPCITRIMHSKACRGAIMFGDELSREECIELVQRLALCNLPFQCAHGRPSLIPLLSLAEEG